MIGCVRQVSETAAERIPQMWQIQFFAQTLQSLCRRGWGRRGSRRSRWKFLFDSFICRGCFFDLHWGWCWSFTCWNCWCSFSNRRFISWCCCRLFLLLLFQCVSSIFNGLCQLGLLHGEKSRLSQLYDDFKNSEKESLTRRFVGQSIHGWKLKLGTTLHLAGSSYDNSFFSKPEQKKSNSMKGLFFVTSSK